MTTNQIRAGCRSVALVAALCGAVALPGVANAASSALPMTAANLQTAIDTPASQATPAQRALADQALQQATVTATTTPISALAPSSTDTPSTMAAASVGRCFGATAYRNTLSVVGITLAWVQVGVQGWCAGPGNAAIVSVSGWNFPSYTAATYCTKSDESYHGGDGSYVGPHTTWAHGLHILQVGEGVNGACAGIRTIEQALRIAYNGYNDGSTTGASRPHRAWATAGSGGRPAATWARKERRTATRPVRCDRMDRPRLALTLGDPAGIGPEIMAKALAEGSAYDVLVPVVVGDRGVLEQAIAGCGLALDVRPLDGPGDARGERGTVDLIDLGNMGEVRFGEIDGAHGRAALEWIDHACALARDGAVEGIVTGPINKEAARKGGLAFPGHTELLADRLGVDNDDVYTMFVVGRLRIFFLTRHLSLRDAIDALSEDRVHGAIVHVAGLLRDLGVDRPHVALAALNPHAGEGGLMGREEIDILRPAVERARADGVHVSGPVPADAVFHQGHEGRFDGVIALYHDQGHVASKTLDFFGTVSATLGLPVIRTSVDHGTAFDLAGQWRADARGQVNALRVGAELAPGVLRARR